jgi:uncharacterized protein YndB with AHSA1/START domain
MSTVKKSTEAMSVEALQSATGKPLATWLEVLDKFDVRANGHAAAAKFLEEKHRLSPWWCQQVTVTYEQERGLRLPGQRADGTFTINVSKTMDCTVEAAFQAWSTESGWNAWFTTGAKLDFQKGGKYENNDKDVGAFTRIIEPGPKRSMDERARIEFTWENAEHCPGSKVTVQFMEKSATKCSVLIAHDKLPNAKGRDGMKEGWTWALASLKSYLETGKPIKSEDWKFLQESDSKGRI